MEKILQGVKELAVCMKDQEMEIRYLEEQCELHKANVSGLEYEMNRLHDTVQSLKNEVERLEKENKRLLALTEEESQEPELKTLPPSKTSYMKWILGYS
jgi:archaellum component FlaC